MKGKKSKTERRYCGDLQSDKYHPLSEHVQHLLVEAHADLTKLRKAEEALDALAEHQARTCPQLANVVKETSEHLYGVPAKRMELPGELEEEKLDWDIFPSLNFWKLPRLPGEEALA
jgi:hypothetical protein